MQTTIKNETFEERQARELEEFKAKQQRELENKKRRDEARTQMKNEYIAFVNKQLQRIQDEYGFNEKVANLIFSKAWEDGHSCGYHEVEIYIEDYVNFVQDILNASK